jgi:hypothetical protein
VHPTVDIVDVAGDAEDFLAAIARFHPHRAALAGPMHNPVRDATQRHHGAGLEGCGLRQAAETGCDPAAVELRELLGLPERAPRRHGQDGLAIGGMNAQGVTPRPPVPAQADREELRAMSDQKSRGFGGPPIKEGASSHICKSGEEKFARILPYPSPVKSFGAKTNHLPNIQG